MREAVHYLVELGHRDIHHVDGGDDPGSADRRRAYRAAMRSEGLTEHAKVIAGAHNEQAGAAAARAMLAEPELPTAVLAGNDRCALGLLDVFTRAGVDVPGQLSLIGYDDSRLSDNPRIDLTTVHQDAAGLARHAVQLAVEMLEEKRRGPKDVVLEPKLVVRGTTAKPRKAIVNAMMAGGSTSHRSRRGVAAAGGGAGVEPVVALLEVADDALAMLDRMASLYLSLASTRRTVSRTPRMPASMPPYGARRPPRQVAALGLEVGSCVTRISACLRTIDHAGRHTSWPAGSSGSVLRPLGDDGRAPPVVRDVGIVADHGQAYLGGRGQMRPPGRAGPGGGAARRRRR